MRYIRVNKFAEMTGFTPNAIYCKIREGAWTDGFQYRKGPDGHVYVDLEGFERWVCQGGGPEARQAFETIEEDDPIVGRRGRKPVASI